MSLYLKGFGSERMIEKVEGIFFNAYSKEITFP